MLGKPTEIRGIAEVGQTGVDEQAAMVLGYPGGELAVLSTAVRTNLHNNARILGTEGEISYPEPFSCILLLSSVWKNKTGLD